MARPVFLSIFCSSFLFLPLKSKPRRGSSTGHQIEGFVYLTLLDHEGGEGGSKRGHTFRLPWTSCGKNSAGGTLGAERVCELNGDRVVGGRIILGARP